MNSLKQTLTICLLVCFSVDLVKAQCWLSSYGRGVGEPLSVCDQDQDKNGALCYPKCRDNYNGVGPVCWETCKPDYTDIGLLCTIHPHAYGKGCCCLSFLGNKNCCSNCKSGYRDDGCTCFRDAKVYVKHSYGRTAGVPLKCRAGLERNGGLCYPKCREGYHGVGPVCWANECKGAYEKQCGPLCIESSSTCKDEFIGLATSAIDLGIEVSKLVSNTLNMSVLIDTYASATQAVTPLLNEICAFPNKAATSCIRGDPRNACDEAMNPVKCGVFCASSKVVCAKNSLILSAAVLEMIKEKKGDEELNMKLMAIERGADDIVDQKDISPLQELIASIMGANASRFCDV